MEENTKKCPFCGEEIMATAKKCRFCGSWLESPADNSNATNGKITLGKSLKRAKIIETICGLVFIALGIFGAVDYLRVTLEEGDGFLEELIVSLFIVSACVVLCICGIVICASSDIKATIIKELNSHQED